MGINYASGSGHGPATLAVWASREENDDLAREGTPVE